MNKNVEERQRSNNTHILGLGLVQQVSFLPVSSFVGLTKVELDLSSLFVLLGFPFVQGHLLSALLFHLLDFVLPEIRSHGEVRAPLVSLGSTGERITILS